MPLVPGQFASASGFGTSVAATIPSAVTAGNLLAYGHDGHSATTNVTDNRNTVSVAINPGNPSGNNLFIGLHYVPSAAAGSTTATRTHAADDASIIVAEFSGPFDTAPNLDKTSSAFGFGTAVNSGTTTTLAQADELAIGYVGGESGPTQTPTNSFIEVTEVGGVRPAQMQYKTLAATTGVASTSTQSIAGNWTAVVATFKLEPPEPPYHGRAQELAMTQRMG